ncbi:diguanylate cyclase domain-containing protein [Deinococcus aestuarii]|uniref:diguanylate cyclase domain-containing protein n=1 Tax=Deinococcus aestuarii TaxID=2774531 RepID=UPI001C0C84AF|nr:diguanylate cyclase [Deinococcus aestuarii]
MTVHWEEAPRDQAPSPGLSRARVDPRPPAQAPLEVLALLQGSDPTLILGRREGVAPSGSAWPGAAWEVAFANHAFARLLGQGPEALCGVTLEALFAGAGESLRAAFPNAADLAARGEPFRVDLPLRSEDIRWMEAQVTPLRLGEGGPVSHWLAVLRDVTAQRQALALATGHTRALHLAAQGAPLSEILGALIATLDERLPGSAACAALCEGDDLVLIGPPRLPPLDHEVRRPAREVRATSCGGAVFAGKPVLALTPEGFPGALREGLVGAGYRRAYSVPIREAGGPVLGAMTLYGRRATPPHPTEAGLLAQFADLAALLIARRQALRRLEYLAFHDGLTGLPNRARFMAVLGEACAGLTDPARVPRQAGGGAFAVGVLDLDGFKLVNDAYGHAAGDGLLVTLARRLTAALPPGVLVARMGGDEFALLVPGASPRRLGAVKRRVRAVLTAPFPLGATLGTATVRLGGSLGWSLAPGEARTPDALLRAADGAMYGVKRVTRSARGVLQKKAPPGWEATLAGPEALEPSPHGLGRRGGPSSRF